MDEGLSGTVTYKKFRAPGKYFGWKRSWFSGSLAITEKRFWAFRFFSPIVSVPLDDPHLRELECSVQGDRTLRVFFDVSVFHEGWSGTIECRFRTPRAREFLDRIRRSAAAQEGGADRAEGTGRA